MFLRESSKKSLAKAMLLTEIGLIPIAILTTYLGVGLLQSKGSSIIAWIGTMLPIVATSTLLIANTWLLWLVTPKDTK